MSCLIGTDLGTSGVKAMLITGSGEVIDTVGHYYAVNFTADGGAEQCGDLPPVKNNTSETALRIF
ncbi:MAG: hypothetical protein ACOX88_03005 [Christensenellales bacterium]|jgi:sugar (pentulose or hexulose) kinase